MEILSNYPLKSLNTFSLEVDGKYFTRVASIDELSDALSFAQTQKIPVLILGGGSNLLFKDDFEGLVIHIEFNGIEIVSETDRHVFVKAGAGENWDDFVQWCVERNLGGLENLSLIPGSVGASPIQNIGAYGVEMNAHFEELEFYDFSRKKLIKFKKENCRFGYRSSIFKTSLNNKGVVVSVTFKLDKEPILHLGYGTIREELEKRNISDPSINDVRNCVIGIRRSKLPDPVEIGNAGSFFKNPMIPASQHSKLKDQWPGLVSFSAEGQGFKLAAAWLIDSCGWKGFREGDAGVHQRQALVLVNYGQATGEQILNLSKTIQESVFNKFGVMLEREVNVI